MEYTIQQLADLAGISTRTLRYYDQIKLLPSVRAVQSGYRIYGEREVDALWQILFFKELGFELSTIAEIINDPSYDCLKVLEEHLRTLKQKELQIQSLIHTVEKTIRKERGEIAMTDQEKFESFKKDMIDENEAKYGKEIREKYGEDTVAESNRKMMNLSREDYDKMTAISEKLQSKLAKAVKAGEDFKSDCGKEIALLHREWLTFTWPKYSAEAHRGLGEMYVADERFTAYYDQEVAGCAQFLRDAICHHMA